MKRVVCEKFAPPNELKFEQVEDPQPAANQALVEIQAAGVGFVDGLMVQGLYQVKPPLPYYPGSEFAGVVSAIGDDVTRISVGERVMGMANAGAYADKTLVKADSLIKLPEQLDVARAAGFYINYATALYGLRDCGSLQAGESVLILGASGGVGSAAICVAKALGATVIAGASTEEKRQAALKFGADYSIDYTADNWRANLKEICPDLNMVYDPVGGDLSETAFRNLAPGGRFLVVGFAAGSIPAIPLNLALLKRSSIVGVDWGGEMRANPHINQALMRDLMQMIESGDLLPAPVVSRPLDEISDALHQQLDGQVVGKLVLIP